MHGNDRGCHAGFCANVKRESGLVMQGKIGEGQGGGQTYSETSGVEFQEEGFVAGFYGE